MTGGPALSASWLSTKLGNEWRFPGWQFDEECRVKPGVARVPAAAHTLGLDSERLNILVQQRSGMKGRDRLLDDRLRGQVEHVVRALDCAWPRLHCRSFPGR